MPFYLLLIVLVIPFVFPFYWMITSSGKTITEIFQYPPLLFPQVWQWENYRHIFEYQPFLRQYFNSIYISLTVMFGVMLISSLSGFGFAKMRFAGKNVIFVLLLSGLMMPVEVTIIPNYVFMQKLDLVNTHIPLILIPIFGSTGIMGMFIMRQFFLNFPQELDDAARMDGLTRFGVFFKIALPLAKPALSTVAILTFLRSWNAYLEPLIYINDNKLFTLPLALPSFVDSMGGPIYEVQLAATALSVIPVLVFLFIAQQNVVESFTQSGIKG
jgi:multiple sugar transport system permease protein